METDDDRNDRLRKQEAKLAGQVAAFAAGVFFLYFSYFTWRRYSLGGPEAWAQFGDYFGGLVNPVVGIVTVILVVRTLNATRAESDLTRLEMRAQTALFSAQLERYDKEKKLAELQKRLDGALVAWNAALSQQHGDLRSDLLPDSEIFGTPYTFGKIFGEANILTEIDEAKASGNPWTYVYGRRWAARAEGTANLLREIALYCIEYDEEAGDRLLTDFYRRRVAQGLRVLSAVGLVQPKTFDALRIGQLTFADA